MEQPAIWIQCCTCQSGSEVDTLILDLRFPGLTCISQLGELRQQLRRTTLIVVSMVDDPGLIEQVMALGADGFIGKNIAPEEIGQALLAIRQGEMLVKFAPSGPLPLDTNTLRAQRGVATDRKGKTTRNRQGPGYFAVTVRILGRVVRSLKVPRGQRRHEVQHPL